MESLPQNRGDSKHLLITCRSCFRKFSQRADVCPKCGWKRLALCQVCLEEIPFDSTVCPECGDPRPFERLKVNKQKLPSAALSSPTYETAATRARRSEISRPPTNKWWEAEPEKKEDKKQSKGFPWKSFLVAFFLALFLHAFAAEAAGRKSSGNIYWTLCWIWLTIESWKY